MCTDIASKKDIAGIMILLAAQDQCNITSSIHVHNDIIRECVQNDIASIKYKNYSDIRCTVILLAACLQ